MRPLSLFKSGHSTGSVSLATLLDGAAARAPEAPLGLTDIIDRICHSGWPGMQQHSTARAMKSLRDYLDEIRRTDIMRVDGKARDPERVGRLLRAYARNVATHASAATIAADAGGDEDVLDRNTVRDYLTALERLMIVEELPQWALHMRARARLRSAAKRHFVDPALAVAALETNPVGLPRDLEVDSIVTADNGRWAVVEVKMGQGQVDAAAASLQTFRDRVDTTQAGDPAALIVITALGHGYTRPDGVHVVPISTLGP